MNSSRKAADTSLDDSMLQSSTEQNGLEYVVSVLLC